MILTICHWWIVGLWVAFLLYWATTAISARRGGLERSAFRRGMGIRLTIFVIIVAGMVIARRSPDLRALQWWQFNSLHMAMAGAVIGTLGAALAFTARAAIGRNWGPPTTERSDTELVTRGPYALVRHPIYGGILLMMIGTAVGLLPVWWLVALAAGTYFLTSARAEERFMLGRFPDSYPAYRARTKMVVPFVI
jgi:protein-S-isoprenylcysteine O-methyltransferase Ste14